MIKLHASFGRKVPGDSQFSSCQASASVEFEVADNDATRIPARLAGAWTMLRQAVEAELARRRDGNHVPAEPFHQGPAESFHPGQTPPELQGQAMPAPHNGSGNGSGGYEQAHVHHAPGVYQPPRHGVPSFPHGAPGNGGGGHNGNGYGPNGHGAPPFVPGAQTAASTAVAAPPSDARATKKQIGFLMATARRTRNWSAEQTKAWVVQQYGCALNDLTKAQAGTLIDALQGR